MELSTGRSSCSVFVTYGWVAVTVNFMCQLDWAMVSKYLVKDLLAISVKVFFLNEINT